MQSAHRLDLFLVLRIFDTELLGALVLDALNAFFTLFTQPRNLFAMLRFQSFNFDFMMRIRFLLAAFVEIFIVAAWVR